MPMVHEEVPMQTQHRPCRHILAALVAGWLIAATAFAHTGSGIAVDRLGQVWFLDTGSGLWKIDTQGQLTHHSPLKNHWLAIDAGNRLAGTRLPSGSLGVVTKVGADPTLLLS